MDGLVQSTELVSDLVKPRGEWRPRGGTCGWKKSGKGPVLSKGMVACPRPRVWDSDMEAVSRV